MAEYSRSSSFEWRDGVEILHPPSLQASPKSAISSANGAMLRCRSALWEISNSLGFLCLCRMHGSPWLSWATSDAKHFGGESLVHLLPGWEKRGGILCFGPGGKPRGEAECLLDKGSSVEIRRGSGCYASRRRFFELQIVEESMNEHLMRRRNVRDYINDMGGWDKTQNLAFKTFLCPPPLFSTTLVGYGHCQKAWTCGLRSSQCLGVLVSSRLGLWPPPRSHEEIWKVHLGSSFPSFSYSA